MIHSEKKYRVESFAAIKAKLNELGAKQIKTTESFHYYGQHPGKDVVKLVKNGERNEIHILTESNGTFTLEDRIPVKDTPAGLDWLKDKGYTQVQLVKMNNTDYEYEGGIVGLYTINDTLHSVILDFPKQEHDSKEKELGLTGEEVIDVPYNKYIAKI